MASVPKKRPLSEVETVYSDVSEKILSGALPEGTRLIETQLAREYGVSRTPVRLAIERLVAQGQAQHLRNCGAVVRRLTKAEVCGLLSIRQVNEALAARWASGRAGKDDRLFFEGCLASMQAMLDEKNLAEYYTLSGQLHNRIMTLCGDEFLIDIIQKVYRITYRYHIDVLSHPGRAAESLEEHRRLVAAILSGDGERAHSAMWEHLGYIRAEYERES